MKISLKSAGYHGLSFIIQIVLITPIVMMPNLFLTIMLWKLKLGNNFQMTSKVFDVHAAASVTGLQETTLKF